MTNLTDLRAKAEAATPGPWDAVSETGVANFHTSIYGDGYKGLLIACGDQNGAHTADMDFIAAANPTTILSLIDRIERLEEALEFYSCDPELCRDCVLGKEDIDNVCCGFRARAALHPQPDTGTNAPVVDQKERT